MDPKADLQLEERYRASTSKPLDVILTKGQGLWVWDVAGRRRLDCLLASSAINQGHGHSTGPGPEIRP